MELNIYMIMNASIIEDILNQVKLMDLLTGKDFDVDDMAVSIVLIRQNPGSSWGWRRNSL
jgi:hypothetical protein